VKTITEEEPMVPMRAVHWAVRLAVVAGTMLFGVLLLGTQHGHAAPPAPVTPTELAQPTLTTSPKPPTPTPAIDVPATDIVIEPPCWQLDTCPPPVDPCADKPEECQPPTKEPTQPPTTDPKPTADPKPNPTTKPAGQPRPAPSVIPTPTRIDTGGGTAAEEPTWMFWVLPGLALLTLAAGFTGWWLAQSEQVRP
jgi:hypothetical protein